MESKPRPRKKEPLGTAQAEGIGEDATCCSPTPAEPLKHIEAAAVKDLRIARLTIGLFETIRGREGKSLIPGYRGGLLEWREFPAELQGDVRALIDWALAPTYPILNPIAHSLAKVQLAVHRTRSRSALGREFRRRAKRLMRLHSPVSVAKWDTEGIIYEVLPDERGRPLTERTIALTEALKPQEIQILAQDACLNSVWIPGVLTIRLSGDGYTVNKITLAVDAPKSAGRVRSRRVEGNLIDYFETGTEGVIWTVEDDHWYGREALEMICEGDHLTILDQLGRKLWGGVIRCDKKTGWQPYPLNPKCGQQCALGCWVHWIQEGFEPDEWAKFFIRPGYDRLHGVLIKKLGPKRESRLGPDAKDK